MRISVIAHFALGAMTSDPTKHVGGVERQVSILTKWLAKRGHEVSLITWDEGQSNDLVVDGVRIIKLCRKDDGIKGLRFFYPRWSSLIGALKSADADIYYQNCAEYITGQIAIWCKLNSKKFIYSVASEPDCDPDLPQMNKLRDKVLYKYGLLNSSRVIVQNDLQKQMLIDGFRLKSETLPMACQGPSDDQYTVPTQPTRELVNIIWVGRLAHVKRPELIFTIAKKIDYCKITVVGGADTDKEYADAIFEQSKSYANVTMLGSVGHEQIEKEYRRASILCCTSEYEGLPNTFLEAWSHGLPIFSTVDPDNTLTNNKTGIFCQDIDALVDEIEKICVDVDRWKLYSDNAREYYKNNHSLDVAMKKFEDTFREVLVDDKNREKVKQNTQ
jgi:glycosyltransferase involved in cell wall biosynthesis